MADLNPYEPPQELTPLKIHQVAKRRIGFGLVLLLTPPAMVIAVGVSCTAETWVRGLPGWTPRMVVTFVGPIIGLTGMMGWAAILALREKTDFKRVRRLVLILLTTPLAVGAAMGIAYAGIIAYVMFLDAKIGLSDIVTIGLAISAFWLLPAATLLAMLWFAWRAR
jgi:hypothetical protein